MRYSVMESGTLVKNGDIKKWVKKYPPGGCLFTPDDAGIYVYLIVKGTVRLFRREGGQEKLVGTVGPGEVLGENLLVSTTYRHSFAARIVSPLEVIQFTPDELPIIESRIPDFKLRLLKTVIERLKQANEFIRIMQTADRHEKIARCVLYYFKYSRLETGEPSTISNRDLESMLQLAEGEATESLKTLEEQRAIIGKDGQYTVSHIEILENQLARWDKRQG